VSRPAPCALRRWAVAFAEEIRAGEVDFLEVAMLAAEELESSLEVCPACGFRPIRPKTTAGRDGQCLACHLRHLADAQRELLAILEARQEHDAAKHLVYRRRRTMGDDLPPELAAKIRPEALPATETGDGAASIDVYPGDSKMKGKPS
jgi:hypothetical protein